jgi:hypothetical protein
MHSSQLRGEQMSASELQRRLAEVSAEIRGYPTPIARCDVQLTALLEQRTALMEAIELTRRPGAGCTPENTWINDGGFNAA